MRKLFAILAIATLSLSTLAQDKITTYEMEYFSDAGTTYDISATEPDGKGEFGYYISMYSFDGRRTPVTINVKQKQLDEFIASIQEAKETYVEWDSVAVVNNVTDLDKSMKVKSPSLMCAWYGTQWWFDYSTKLSFNFKHIEGKPVLIIRTGKLVASSNQYIDSEGGAFVFTSVEEIDAFLSALDPTLVTGHFAAKNQKQDLFED